jgi:CheY-like chemotaxis protein
VTLVWRQVRLSGGLRRKRGTTCQPCPSRPPSLAVGANFLSDHSAKSGLVKLGKVLVPMPSARSNSCGVEPITVLLTNDDEVVRSSIRRLLDSDLEIHTVGEAVNFQQTIQRAIELKPQIVLMDLRMVVNSSVNPQEIKSHLNTSESRLIAMSFWTDEDAQALAERLGAVTLVDKLTLKY